MHEVAGQGLDPDEHVREVVKRNWKGGEEGGKIYGYRVSCRSDYPDIRSPMSGQRGKPRRRQRMRADRTTWLIRSLRVFLQSRRLVYQPEDRPVLIADMHHLVTTTLTTVDPGGDIS